MFMSDLVFLRVKTAKRSDFFILGSMNACFNSNASATLACNLSSSHHICKELISKPKLLRGGADC